MPNQRARSKGDRQTDRHLRLYGPPIKQPIQRSQLSATQANSFTTHIHAIEEHQAIPSNSAEIRHALKDGPVVSLGQAIAALFHTHTGI